ncbi:MAG: hypothetical protein H7833_09695 [Magnetococcus sp. DMHC-1]|nr:hypothetical protein [Magnetococcales bacterium]
MNYRRLSGIGLAVTLVAVGACFLLAQLFEDHGQRSHKTVSVADRDAFLVRGRQVALACIGCHDLSPRRHPSRNGPPLWGIIDQPAGRYPGFAYSGEFLAIVGQNCLVWTEGALSRFLTHPRALHPDTLMKHSSVGNPRERRDLLLYLLTLTDGKAAASAGASTPSRSPAPTANVPGEAEASLEGNQADLMEIGIHEAEKCRACHDLTDRQRNLVGPHLWGVVGRTAGWVNGYCYSVPFLQKTGQKLVWDEQSLYLFLAAPKTFIPGTKMLFDGIPKAEYRVGLINYLRSLKPQRSLP